MATEAAVSDVEVVVCETSIDGDFVIDDDPAFSGDPCDFGGTGP